MFRTLFLSLAVELCSGKLWITPTGLSNTRKCFSADGATKPDVPCAPSRNSAPLNHLYDVLIR